MYQLSLTFTIDLVAIFISDVMTIYDMYMPYTKQNLTSKRWRARARSLARPRLGMCARASWIDIVYVKEIT